MDLTFTGEFKSLTNFQWVNVPMLAVITGANGSGKSQLLQLIYDTVSNSYQQRAARVTITGESYKRGEVAFLRSEWHLTNTYPLNLMHIQNELDNMFNQFHQPSSTQQVPKLDFFIESIAEQIGKHRTQVTKEEFEKHARIDYYQDEPLITHQIARIFVDYNISLVERRANGLKDEEIIEELGPKPWNVLNEIMKESKLPFEFNNPTTKGLRDSFTLEITDTNRGCTINFEDLSSGEKVLVSLVIYLYNSKEKKFFPRLLIMDEPDAHLHPAMTKQFLDVILNVFVRKHNIRIIMSTHSPSTVALTPEDYLFEMSRTEPRLQKSPSKNKTISLLTAGLVTVGPGTRFILVEDEDDTKFYGEVYNYFISNNHISGRVPFVFIAASTTTKSGGKSQVYEWVEKLAKSGLDNVFHGIIDKDHGNPQSSGIFILDRYSFENYLLDPIIVYAALMDKEEQPSLIGINLSLGEEYKLKTLQDQQLQAIADHIHNMVQSHVETHFSDFKQEEKELIQVEMVSGQKLYYPKWLVNRRGKTLLNEVYGQKVFHSKNINPSSLMRAFRKIHFIPKDLQSLYLALEN